MIRLFDSHILPILEKHKPKEILEIGVLRGATTLRLLYWCSKNNAHLTSVDPTGWVGDFPDNIKVSWHGFAHKDDKNINASYIESIYKQRLDKYWTCYKTISTEYLSTQYKGCDLCLIDGDHNYFTVSTELKLLDKKAESGNIILLHDISKKSYGRKDFYSDPLFIPTEWRNGKKQGVLTAIEDFMRENYNECTFKILTKKNDGLGKITQKQVYPSLIIRIADILSRFTKLKYKGKSSERVSADIYPLF